MVDKIRHMRLTWWITKATNTLRLCNTYCVSTVTTGSRTRLDVTLYVHCCLFDSFNVYAIFKLRRRRKNGFLLPQVFGICWIRD
jgi:hypothetical protein